MSMRAMATATIGFGLVSVPVKVYTSSESAAQIRFNQLHSDCGKRLKQALKCPDHDEVSKDDIIKGYEYTKDRYVTFTPDELKALTPESTKSVEITEFVKLEDVDRLYIDKTYYLGPDKGGDKPYKLLALALEKTGQAALARYTVRGNQYLVLVRPHDGGLAMEQLRYKNQIRSMPAGDDVEVSDAELALAVQLVTQSTSDGFHPENYKDEVYERVMALIQGKIDGNEITEPEAVDSEGEKITDLMEALKASIATTGKKKAKKKKSKK